MKGAEQEGRRMFMCGSRLYSPPNSYESSSLLSVFRDPFSIQYRCIRNARFSSSHLLSLSLSNVPPFSLSSTPVFSHRYRYYLKPRRVSSSWPKERDATGIEMRMIVSYVQKHKARCSIVRILVSQLDSSLLYHAQVKYYEKCCRARLIMRLT